MLATALDSWLALMSGYAGVGVLVTELLSAGSSSLIVGGGTILSGDTQIVEECC